jgi:ankyrin repeat protein
MACVSSRGSGAASHRRSPLMLACLTIVVVLGGCETEKPDPVRPRLESLAYDAALPELQQAMEAAGLQEIDRRDDQGKRLLEIAAERNQPMAAAALVSAGSSIWAVDGNGDTVMHYAVRARATQVISELTRFMPNLKLRNKDGLTPAALADKIGFSEGARLLRAH